MPWYRPPTLAVAGLLVAAIAWPRPASAHGDHHEPFESAEKAVTVLVPTATSRVRGTVTFSQGRGGVMVRARVEGLLPGEHGFHVHEWGDCTAPDASSAGGHFAPWESPHGGPEAPPDHRHAGDLGNLVADERGIAEYLRLDRGLSLQGPDTIVGRAVIVHEKADDLVTQPTGGAGGRVACGVVGIARP